MKHSIHTLLALTEPITESGCWIFHGHLNADGYARVHMGGRHVKVHRVFYEHFIGPIMPKLVPDHLCRIRCCVNPWHLEIVTDQVNTLRGEGPTAKLARKNLCKNGHPFDRMQKPGADRPLVRACSICLRLKERLKRIRRREKELAKCPQM